MICKKCGAELTDGARFCTTCGAECGTVADVKPAEPPKEPEKKCFCQKCGLELQFGAKFCTACGAPMTNVGNISPIPNNGETFGNGTMDSVSLNNEPSANDLVAAMPTAVNLEKPAAAAPASASAAATATIPKPAAAPAAAAATVPEPVSAPAAITPEAYPQAQRFAPTAPVNGGFNGMNGAAAVTAAPAKKGSGAKIALIIVIVLVLLIGGAAVFFFTNKATFMSIVMGKPKYAATIEKNSIKEITEKIDTETISTQIKSFSSLMSAIGSADINPSNPVPSLSLTDKDADPEFVKLANEAAKDGVDMKAFIKGYNEYMKSVYGGNRINGTASVNLEFGDKLKDNMDSDTNAVLDVLNGAELTYDFAATDKLIGAEGGIKINGKPINAKLIAEEDGTVYISFPFASDKALKMKVPTIEGEAAQETAVLDLDSKEISRLITELTDIYTKYIKESSVTMESGSINVGGTSVSGKQITAEISGKNLENLFKELFDHIANDSYFCEKITAYVKNFDDSFTAEKYKSSITDIVSDWTAEDSEKIIVTTIVTNSGKILAKNYTVTDGSANEKIECAYMNSDSQFIFEVKENDKTLLVVNNAKTSEKDGTVTITIGTDDNESIDIAVTYAGAGKAKFGVKDISVGTYTVKFDTSNVKDKDDDTEMLDGFSLSLSSSVDGNTAKFSASLDAKDLLTMNISEDITISDDAASFEAPSDFIDISALVNGESLDEDTTAAIQEYSEDLLNGIKDALAGTGLEEYLNGSAQLPDINAEPDNENTSNNENTSKDDEYSERVYELQEKTNNELMEVYDWFDDNNVYSGSAYDKAKDYQDKLRDLDDRLWEAYINGCTKAQFEAFQDEYDELTAQKKTLKKAVEKAGKNKNDNSTSKPSSSKKSSNNANSESAMTGSVSAGRVSAPTV